MSAQLTSHTTTPLLALLADLVLDDFGPVELSLVRERLALTGASASASASASAVGEVCRFLTALAAVQRRPAKDSYLWAGRRLVAPVAKERPTWLRDHTSVRSMLLQLGRIAPVVVETWVGEGTCPEFWGDFLDGETVQIGFDGPEEAAWVLEGAVVGFSELFGERAEVSRAVPAASLLERRLVNTRVIVERRAMQRGARPTVGLSSSGHRS